MEIVNVVKIFGKGTVVIGKILCDIYNFTTFHFIEDSQRNILQNTFVMNDKVYPLRISSIDTFNKSHNEAVKDQDVALMINRLEFVPTKGMSITRKKNEKE